MERAYQHFGPFLIIRTLGRGGMGEVFIARTPWTENPVAAVKRLRPDVARVPTFAERFQHESELAVRLEHENVVGTLDVGSVNGQLYVASELVLGKDTGIIADRLRERGQGGPAAVAIRLMLDVLTGLAYVHEARDLDGTPLELVHRDITPGNVLVSYDGVAKLADFGLAKSLLTEKANLTQHGEILGTPHYLAPEIIRGEPATGLSDLYGLGAVMYRFLTGVAPHHGTTAEVLLKVLSEEPRSLSELRPDLSPWLVNFVHRLLTKSPTHRPSDARQLVSKLGHEARAAGLLVPRSAVGRWLADLFSSEKDDELEERDRLVAMSADQYTPKGEGTVVLAARVSSGPRFKAPATNQAEPLEYDDSLNAGTDLAVELGDSTDAQAAPSHVSLGAAVPSDVTDSSEVLPELSELDGMPTRAVTLQPNFLDEESGTHEMISRSDLIAEPEALSDAATHFNPLPDDEVRAEAPTALPGFIDPGERPSYTPSDTNPEPDGVLAGRSRPRGPGSVVVQPLAGAAPARPTPDGARKVLSPADRGAPAPSPVRPFRPFRPPAKPAARNLQSRPSFPGRNLLLLAGMLAVAVLLGVFVGALVVSYRNPGIAVVAPQDPLHEQLFRVQTRLVGRVEQGEVVPAEVWSKLTRVHAALKEGNEVEAAALLDELETEP